ncbi:MAG: DUF5024 domain-containing protein [Tannerellaceae bacterium]|jgi:hypothetical protein|nr:DUF5024 domain-containing protein [Tannerellaceae bacterium]
MKTRHLIAAAILLITGSLSANLPAQETLKALVKKCESMDNVNTSVVRNRNKQTKKLEKEIISLNFSNNQALVNEFIAAFEKDKLMADKEIEGKNNGKKTLFYRFGDTSYSFSQLNEGSASVSVIQKDEYEYEE